MVISVVAKMVVLTGGGDWGGGGEKGKQWQFTFPEHLLDAMFKYIKHFPCITYLSEFYNLCMR